MVTFKVLRNDQNPDPCGPVGWVSFCKLRGHWFDSRSGHIAISTMSYASFVAYTELAHGWQRGGVCIRTTTDTGSAFRVGIHDGYVTGRKSSPSL